MSSASKNAIYFPFACLIPLFLATACFLFCCFINLILRSIREYSEIIFAELSVDPSSINIASQKSND